MIASLLLITALTIPTNTLVLRSGDRIFVDGSIVVQDRTVLFHSGGRFFSVGSDDVDFAATRDSEEQAASPAPNRGKLRVSPEERQRLLKELEENHSGTPAPAMRLDLPPEPTASDRKQATQDEWAWRNQARSYEESVRRAQEDLDLLRDRADEIKSRILGFLALGFKPEQFTYDSTQLAYTLDAIPGAELEVTRAQRAWDQFRDDARRQGVMPGWLR